MTKVIAPGHEVIRDLKTNRVHFLVRRRNNNLDRLVRVNGQYMAKPMRAEQLARRLHSHIARDKGLIDRMVCAEGA